MVSQKTQCTREPKMVTYAMQSSRAVLNAHHCAPTIRHILTHTCMYARHKFPLHVRSLQVGACGRCHPRHGVHPSASSAALDAALSMQSALQCLRHRGQCPVYARKLFLQFLDLVPLMLQLGFFLHQRFASLQCECSLLCKLPLSSTHRSHPKWCTLEWRTISRVQQLKGQSYLCAAPQCP
jgi:hypothetical protein